MKWAILKFIGFLACLLWPFNKIAEWIDRYYQRRIERMYEEEEELFQKNLNNLWQRPEKKDDE